MGTPTLICAAGHTVRGERGRVHAANQEILNKNLAIANRSCVSCAHNTF